jgi:hypothetical protein
MQLIFVDETSDSKFKDYFGLCVTTINCIYYRELKTGFHKILRDGGWNLDVEFKGEYLFSASKGCPSVQVDKRVEIAESILALNKANKNRRMKFFYFRKKSSDPTKDYLAYLPVILSKALSKALVGGGKDVAVVHCDFRSDINAEQIRNVIAGILSKKGYTLFEDVLLSRSNSHTTGILFADIAAYLIARIDTIANDSQLFENIPPEQLAKNGKYQKMTSSTKLIGLIKDLERYEIKAP